MTESYTYRQLTKMAKEKNIKYFAKYRKNDLEKMLGLEVSKPNETFEKYCREKVKKPLSVIIINKKTGEIFNFKSLYAAGKKVGVNPQIIKNRIRLKKDLKIKEDTFLTFFE